MSEYDISKAFKRIENDLMDSMMRNLKRHQAEETEMGFNWEQWQVLQLKELERYRKENAKLFTPQFAQINKRIDDLFRKTLQDAQAQEEAKILDDIKKGKYRAQKKDVSFFNVNDDKLNILIERTKADFVRAEYAVLRKAEDDYRKVIFDAQVYANITNDYAKAVDMATHDFIMNGYQSIQYKGWTDKTGKYHAGARHNISDYAEMAIRTGNKRAYLMGEGNAHDAFGIHTIRVNKRTQACPLCVGYLGKVMVDDVYAGGTPKEASQMGVPLLSQAIANGFLHPNCKDIYSMYIEGVSQKPKPWTKQEITQIVGDYNQEQELKHAQDMQESYARMAKYSLDPSNQARYQARADGWQTRVDDIKAGMPPMPIIPSTPKATPKPVEAEAITEASMLQDAVNGSQSLKDLASYANANKVDYRTVNPLPKKLTEDEIINRLAGGDMTTGSCVSLSCAFAGNLNGYDVLDFRGGASCKMFALNMNNRKLCDLPNVVAKKVTDFSAVKGAQQLLSDMEEGKLYILVTGKHASVVRKTNGIAQYLELQSASRSGWHNFESKTLKNRFGCTRSRTVYGTKLQQLSYTIEIDSLYNNKEFNDLLGFINTADDKQKKGALGSVK